MSLVLFATKMVFLQILCNVSKVSIAVLVQLEFAPPPPLTTVIDALLVAIVQLVLLLLSLVLLVITLTLEV